MPVIFNGDYLVTPAVASSIDDSLMYPVINPSGNVLALIGESEGGVPKKPLRIRSPLQAQKLLRSGPLLEGAIRAFAPAVETGSPASIYVVRANPATQSSVVLKDAEDNPVLDIKSTDYGSHTRALEVRIENGSSHGKRVSVRQDGVVYYQDNLGPDVFEVQYNGAEATSAVTVTANGILRFEAPSGTAVREYTLSDWPNAAALAEAISDSLTDWSFTCTRGEQRFNPVNLDAVAITDASTKFALRGTVYSVFNYINSFQEILLDAEYSDSSTKSVLGNIDWTPLTGGTNGSTLAIDWEDCFSALHEVEAHWLVPLTDDPAIWDMTASHCDYMSSKKRERRAFIGGGTGVTSEQAQVNAYTINSDRVGYVWPGVYEYEFMTRRLILKPAYLAAVNLAAGFAAINPGTTLSRKAISVAGAETMLSEPEDTDSLISAGVCALVQSDRGVIVSQAVSTWQQDARYNRREISCGAAVDYVARSARANLERMLGERASPEAIPRAYSALESILSDLSVAPPNGPGILVGDSKNPPYRNIQVELEADVLKVSFECSPVIPINYVLIPISVMPYKGSSM